MTPRVAVIIDTETSGLDPNDNEILSVACQAIDLHTLRVLDSYHSLVRPFYPERATKRAMETNGLDLAVLATAPAPHAVLAEVAAFCGAYGRPLIGGHNVRFDLGFLAVLEASYGVSIPRHGSLVLDTADVFRAYVADLREAREAALDERKSQLATLRLEAPERVAEIADLEAVIASIEGDLAALPKGHALPVAAEHLGIAHEAHEVASDVDACVRLLAAVRERSPEIYEAHTTKGYLVADTLERMAQLDAVAAKLREAIAETQAAKALGLVIAESAALNESLQRMLESDRVLVKTSAGGEAGWKVKRERTYDPAMVRRLLPPETAEKCIKTTESVVYGTLESYTKALVKSGDIQADTLDVIKAGATVKMTRTWSCKAGQTVPADLGLVSEFMAQAKPAAVAAALA